MSFAFNRALSSIVVRASGVVTWDERERVVRIAEKVLAGAGRRNVLIDLTGLSSDNDPEEVMAFRALLREKRESFRNLRIAVVPAPEFPLSSVHALELRKFGVQVVEFAGEREARAWLAGDGDTAETPDEPISLW
jgi:hypothetical protein